MRRVCALEEIEDGGCLGVEVDGEDVLLHRRGGRVSAYQGRCPHQQAPLAKGAVEEGLLVCPFHHAVFELENGARRAGPGLGDLARFAVEVEGGEVRVGSREGFPQAPAPRQDAPLAAIVGAGAAGLACAVSLRRYGHDGPIVLIDEQPDPLYERTTLSKAVLAGSASTRDAWRMPPEELEALSIETRFGRRVRAIRAEDQAILFEDGELLTYELCFAAPGSAARALDLPGADLPGVEYLRQAEDAERFLAAAREAGRAVVIGGGFIGLEASASLAQAGVQTELLTREAAPGAKRFGRDVGEMLAGLLAEAGVRVRREAEPESFAPDGGSGRLGAVLLKDGARVETTLALVAVGEARRGEVVAGLAEPDGAVPVDADLKAASGLWVGGDAKAAEARGGRVRTKHWRAAEQDGRVAAAAMMGRERPAEEVPFFWSKVGAPLHAAGDIDPGAETHDVGAVADRAFTRYYLRDGVVVGALGSGKLDDTHRYHALRLSRREPWRLRELLEATGRS